MVSASEGPSDQNRLRPIQPIAEPRALKPARCRQQQAREERRGRDANLRVRPGDAPLGSGDVGPALEQLGWQRERNRRRITRQRRLRDGERRRELAHEDRNGVLELRALDAQIDRVSSRGLELRLRLRHVAARGNASVVAVRRQIERLLECLDRVLEQRRLRVEGADLEVVGGDLGVYAEAHVLEVGGARLHTGAAGRDALSHASPHVSFVRGIDRHRVGVAGLRRDDLIGAGSRQPLPGDRRVPQSRSESTPLDFPRRAPARPGIARRPVESSGSRCRRAFRARSSSESWKRLHQSPLTAASAGVAGVQDTPGVAAAASLNVGGAVSTVGRTYFGPTVHAAVRHARAVSDRSLETRRSRSGLGILRSTGCSSRIFPQASDSRNPAARRLHRSRSRRT